MAKRFSDSEKWKDVWFTELTNDQKIIWIYLLDNCDNAGIFKLNMKLINFNCSTNISVENFIFIFKDRITQINKESWLINKFCIYQYGTDFLSKTSNKAVQSAIKKLEEINILQLVDGKYTLSIPYLSPINPRSIGDVSPIDTPKDKEQEKYKVEDTFNNKNEDEETVIDKLKRKVKLEDEFKIIFKNIPNVIKHIQVDNLDLLQRNEKRLFDEYYQKILEYKKIII